jgi:hypothetical protein
MQPTLKGFASRQALFRNKFSGGCHDILPWLISFSLGLES